MKVDLTVTTVKMRADKLGNGTVEEKVAWLVEKMDEMVFELADYSDTYMVAHWADCLGETMVDLMVEELGL